MTFLFFSRMDETYADLRRLMRALCERRGFDLADDVLDDVLAYQRARIPVFAPAKTSFEFRTNVPQFFEELTKGAEPPEIERSASEIEVRFKPHAYATETEFNLRRVACGYTLNIGDAIVTRGRKSSLPKTTIPAARNLRLAGNF
jgi:hypothetical protein